MSTLTFLYTMPMSISLYIPDMTVSFPLSSTYVFHTIYLSSSVLAMKRYATVPSGVTIPLLEIVNVYIVPPAHWLSAGCDMPVFTDDVLNPSHAKPSVDGLITSRILNSQLLNFIL